MEQIASPIEYLPVFQRGGSIIPRKNRVRRSSKLMVNDPYTLTVALDTALEASGEIYLDDKRTFAFETEAQYTQVKLTASKNGLQAALLHRKFVFKGWIERIDVYGFQGTNLPKQIVRKNDGAALQFSYDAASDRLTIRKPDVLVTDTWEFQFLSQ